MLQLRVIASPMWWGNPPAPDRQTDFQVLRAGSDDVVAAVGECRPLAPDHTWREWGIRTARKTLDCDRTHDPDPPPPS